MSAVNPQIIYPMFAMFLLTLISLGRMFSSRVRAIKAGQLKVNDFKVYTTPQPEDVLKYSRHFTNLFEAPVLFYVVCILGILCNFSGNLFVILAWLYVIARVIHTIIHTGSNLVMWRMRVYGTSWLFLTAMWVLVLLQFKN